LFDVARFYQISYLFLSTYAQLAASKFGFVWFRYSNFILESATYKNDPMASGAVFWLCGSIERANFCIICWLSRLAALNALCDEQWRGQAAPLQSANFAMLMETMFSLMDAPGGAQKGHPYGLVYK
jgi:hypothetical protein